MNRIMAGVIGILLSISVTLKMVVVVMFIKQVHIETQKKSFDLQVRRYQKKSITLVQRLELNHDDKSHSVHVDDSLCCECNGS